MTAASDKARFYLEQYVPELQEYARKELFTRDQISAIAKRRSDFEHILNARGSTPADYARYATYEMNLDSLRKKRSRRLGVKSTNHSGQRTVFFVLERATKKFPGDMGLWMQYIQFCQQEKANKKLARVFTQVLRLKPREHGLWVLAAKHYAEEQGDMSTARSYFQRGLRFCKDKRDLWLEYVKLEMVYLAKLSARRRVLGLDEDQMEREQQDDGENTIMLPTITAEDALDESRRGVEMVDSDALRRLASAPIFTGAIPMAIFDAAVKQFKDNPGIAEDFFDLVASFDKVPSVATILQHIITHLQKTAPTSPEAIVCEAQFHFNGIDLLSAGFPHALGSALSRLKVGLATVSEQSRLALVEKAILMLLPCVKAHADLDADILVVLEASINQYLKLATTALGSKSIKSKVVRDIAEKAKAQGKLTCAEVAKLMLKEV